MHGKGYCHNNISLKNITFNNAGDPYCVSLINFDNASKVDPDDHLRDDAMSRRGDLIKLAYLLITMTRGYPVTLTSYRNMKDSIMKETGDFKQMVLEICDLRAWDGPRYDPIGQMFLNAML